MKTPLKWAIAACCVFTLAGTFTLYSQPDFLVQMANQLWACF
jgi:hypothetical protein